jgi:hypothetical protein
MSPLERTSLVRTPDDIQTLQQNQMGCTVIERMIGLGMPAIVRVR